MTDLITKKSRVNERQRELRKMNPGEIPGVRPKKIREEKRSERRKEERNEKPEVYRERNRAYYYRKRYSSYPPLKLVGGISFFEKQWGLILKEMFPFNEFKKVRPPWLRNPGTGYPLELNFYCEELKLAVEISGSQHFQFSPRFHKTYEKFRDQKMRDKIKRELCEKRGVKLFVIRFDDIFSKRIREIENYVYF